jgi:peptidoglycan/LPS O-acetylase OafA/YrhL
VLGVHVQAIDLWARIGWLGVDLFFVLSGFLISNLLFSEYQLTQRISLRSFYLRRALKLYPGFYLLLFSTLVFCWIDGRHITPRLALGEFFFVQNYLGGLWGHTWSLAVEEHFYLILPLLLIVLAARSPEGRPFARLPLVFVCVAAGCLVARILTWKFVPFDYSVHFQRSHLRFDSLFFGVLLGYYFNFRPDVIAKVTGKYRQVLFYGSFVCVAPCIVLPNSLPFMYTVGFSLVYLGFGGLLLLALFGKDGRLQTEKPAGFVERGMAKMGVFSYGIYLWHVPMAMMFAGAHDWLGSHHINPEPYSFFVAYLAASVLFGVATSKLVEFPVLRLRDRYIPRRDPLSLHRSGDLCYAERADQVHGLGKVLVRVGNAEP